LSLIKSLCPEGERSRLIRPFDKGLPQKRGTSPPPMHSRHPLLSIELEVSQNASLNFLSTHKLPVYP
jgi:hypothetical protein